MDRAFLWENGRMKDLGPTSGPKTSLNPQDLPTQGINARGQVIAPRFFWSNGTRTDLGFLAHDLNNRGQIVGVAEVFEDASPVFWQNGRRVGLTILPRAEAGEAVAINDRSQTVGWCSDPGDDCTMPVHAVLWTLKR